MSTPRFLEPCRTDANADCRPSTVSLPASMLSEQVQRVAIASLVGIGLWSYGLTMDGLVRPLTIGTSTRIGP